VTATDLAAIKALEVETLGWLVARCGSHHRITEAARLVVDQDLDLAAEVERLREAIGRVASLIGDCNGHRHHLSLDITRCPWCMVRAVLDGVRT
jgi:hypothetical protein